MKYSMIRYDYSGDEIKWTALRGGKVVAEGNSRNIASATELAENAVLNVFEAEKIGTVVLMGVGINQLALLKTSR